MSDSKKIPRFSDFICGLTKLMLIILINFSELLIQIIVARGVNENGEQTCLFDTASLKFKFNEIYAKIQKLLNQNSDYDCQAVKKNVLILQNVIQDLSTRLRLNQSVGFQPGVPLQQSTPEKEVDDMLSMSYHSLDSPLKPQIVNKTYVQNTPQRRIENLSPPDLFVTARQNLSSRKL
jgi:hypothetical protein